MSSPLRLPLQSVWISLCQCSLWYHKIQKTFLRTMLHICYIAPTFCLSPWLWPLSHDVIAERNNINLIGLAEVSCENFRLGWSFLYHYVFWEIGHVFYIFVCRFQAQLTAQIEQEGVESWVMSQVASYGEVYRAKALWWSVLHCNTWLMCTHKQWNDLELK